MEENSKEYYMVKAKEYETECHYLSEILKKIIAEIGYDNDVVEALARVGYNAYTEKRKSLNPCQEISLGKQFVGVDMKFDAEAHKTKTYC